MTEQGKPVDGAQISLSAIRYPDQLKVMPAAAAVGNCTYSIRSNTSGQFDFYPIWPGRYALRAEAQGFLPFENFDVQTVTEPQTIVLRTKGDIQAIVLDEMNEPVFLAVVNLKAKSSPGMFMAEQQTTQKGECFFKDLLPGTYTLQTKHPDYLLTDRSHIDVLLTSRNQCPLYLQRKGHTVSGLVLEEGSKNPVPDFYVQLKPDVGNHVIASASSDQQGAFHLLNVPKGRFSLHEKDEANRLHSHSAIASYDDTYIPKVNVTNSDIKDIVFWVAPKASISGRVLTKQHEPVAQAFVGLELGGWWITTESLQDGFYQMKSLPLLPKNEKRTVHLSAYHKQRGFGKTPEISYKSGDTLTNADIILSEGIVLAGKVTQPDGKPITGAVLTFIDQEPGGTGLSWKAQSDSQGEYRFEEVLPRWDGMLTAEGHGYETKKQKITLPEEKKEERIDFVLNPANNKAVITGTVADRNGRPLEDVQLMVQQTGTIDIMVLDKHTDSEGRFKITGLYADRFYNIHLKMSSYPFLETIIYGIPAGSENIVLSLWFEPVTVTVRLDDSALPEKITKNSSVTVQYPSSKIMVDHEYFVPNQQPVEVVLDEPGQFVFSVMRPECRGKEPLTVTEDSPKQISLAIHLTPTTYFSPYFLATYPDGQRFNQPFHGRLRLLVKDGQQPFEDIVHFKPTDYKEPELLGVAGFMVYDEGLYELTVWDQFYKPIKRTILYVKPSKDSKLWAPSVRLPDVIFPAAGNK